METIEINGEEYVKKSSINLDLPVVDEVWEIGESYHIETVTKYYTGVLVKVTNTDFVLSKACWIASTGYFSDYCKGAAPSESEPFAEDQLLNVSRGAYCCAVKRGLVLELSR